MKLTRNPTTDANPNLRGEKHYFTVENAPALMLEAMDELLEKDGWENDSCPCYDDGFGCGWWIDVEEIAAFKADYKRLKGEVAAYVNSKMAQHQGDTLDAMPVEDVEVVARVVRQVARDLRSKQESLSALRAIGTTRAIIMNPYYNTYRPLSQKGWELIHAVLMVGSMEDVISWLYALERNCEASTERRPAIAKLMQNVPGATHEEAHRAIRAANNIYDRAFQMLHDYQAAKEAHAEALAMNDAFDRSFHRRAANWGAMDWMSREIELEKAHEAALAMDATFEENLVFLATPDMADIWYKHTDTLKARILAAAHAEALALDAEFGNPARFEYVNANGHKQSQLLKEAHAEALEISELVSLGCDAPCFMLHLIIKRQAGGYAVGVTDIPPRVTYNPLAASFWEVMPDLSGRPKDERETRSKMRQFMRDGDSIISIGDAIAETMRFALGANWIEIVRRWEMGK